MNILSFGGKHLREAKTPQVKQIKVFYGSKLLQRFCHLYYCTCEKWKAGGSSVWAFQWQQYKNLGIPVTGKYKNYG